MSLPVMGRVLNHSGRAMLAAIVIAGSLPAGAQAAPDKILYSGSARGYRIQFSDFGLFQWLVKISVNRRDTQRVRNRVVRVQCGQGVYFTRARSGLPIDTVSISWGHGTSVRVPAGYSQPIDRCRILLGQRGTVLVSMRMHRP